MKIGLIFIIVILFVSCTPKKTNYSGEYFRIVKLRPFLKETPLYFKVEALAIRVLEQINILLNKEKYQEVIKLAKENFYFLPIQDQLKEIIEKVKSRLKFFASIKSKDYKTVYAIIEKYEEFKYLHVFSVLDSEFRELIKKCFDMAHNGKTRDIYKLLNVYFGINYRVDKVAQVMKLSYINELRSYADHTDILWKETFENYCKLFSKDDAIIQLSKEIGKEKFLKELDSFEDYVFGYRQTQMVENIIVREEKKESKKEEDKNKKTK